MGIVIRQGIKGTLVSYGGALLGYVNLLLLFPLLFSTEQIGVYRVLLDAAAFFVIFSQLGISNISIKYFPYFKDIKKKHNGFLFYILLVPIIGFSLLSLAFMIFKEDLLTKYTEKSPLLLDYEIYLIPLAFCLLFIGVITTYSRSLMRIVLPKFIREIGVRLIITTGAALFFLEVLNFNGFIVLVVSGYGFALLTLIVYIKHLKQWFIKPDFAYYKPEMVKEMTVFGMFMLLGTGGGIIVAKIDTLMLGAMAGLSETGIYTIAFYIGAVLEFPRRALTEIATPVLANAFKEDNKKVIKELYHKTSLNLLIIGGFFFICIWSNIDSIFQLIPNSEVYAKGKYVVLCIGLAKLFNMAMGINAEIITNSKYFRWNIILMPLLAILAIITNYFLIPMYGITGAAIASLISIFLYNLIRFLLVVVKLKLQPFSFSTVKALFALGVVLGVNQVLPGFDNVFVDIGVRTSIIIGVYAFLILILKPSEDISDIFKTFTGKLINR